MKVSEILKDFENENLPLVAAAAYLGINPVTITRWERIKNGVVPEQWAALYREKRRQEKWEK